ncbi:unnamed protein product [Rhizophagus irregularis]|nr:unnamed protein product [Rhizophagus irregularis]
MSTISENDPISTEPNTVEFSKEDVSESNLFGVARINIVNVKNLNSDTLDVRITCLESGNKYSKTHICENINSKWNQVFYIPIYDIDKKLKIRVCGDIAFFKSISLGSYIFNPKNFIEEKKLDLERDLIKPKNSILPRPNKGNLRFDADFYSFSNRTNTTKFSKTIIFFYSLCNLITYQSQDDSVKLDKLVNLFNFNSEKELKELRKTFIDTINDKKVKTISDNILIADIEERLYNLAKKFIIKHFKTNEPSWISWVGEAIQSATIDVSQSTTKSEVVKDFADKFVKEFVDKLTDLIKFQSKFENTRFVSQEVNVTIEPTKITTQNEKALAWLHTQIKDEKLVKEILESCEKIVVEKVSNKKKESSWPSLTTSLTGWGSSWGKYITDTNTADTVSSTLVILESKTTLETTKKIVENQKPDGSIKLDKIVSDQINIASDNIQSSVQTYGISDKLKSVTKNAWETALSLRYLNITSQSQDQHKEQSEKAKKYLIGELKDEKLVEELLTTSEKIIVEQSVKKEMKDAVSTIQNSTTTEKAKEIVSSQKEDGSLELSDTVSKALDVESNESLVSSIKTYFINKGTKVPEDKKLIDTAITLSFLRKTSSTDTSPELKEKIEKAEKYLKTELGSEEKVKELLEKTDTVVVEHATKKVIKEKAYQVLAEKVQESVTQNEDSSFEVSKQIINDLGITNISSIIDITDERVKKLDKGVWDKFLTLAYCNIVLGRHKTKWTNEELEKEILDREIDTAKYTEVIHDALSCQWDDGSLQLSDTVSKELKFESADSLVSHVERCLKSEGDKVPKNQYLRDNKQLLRTAIILYFLKTKHIPPELKEKYEKALKYLRTELGSDNSEKVMDRISLIINNVRAMKEAEEKGLVAKVLTDTAKSTEEVIHDALLRQRDDGSLQLSKELKFESTDSLVSHVERCLESEGDKVPKNQYLRDNKQLLHTAIILYFLKTKHIPPELKEKYEKAVEYLRTELGSDFEKVMDSISMIINTVCATKEAEEKELVTKVLTDTAKSTEEIIHDALSCQKDDGSLQFSDTVSKKLESLVLRVASCLESEGDKVPKNQYLRDNKRLLHTAIILNFLKTTHIPPELKEKHEKAVKYLKTELGSDSEEVMIRINMIINTICATKEAEEKELVTKVLTDTAKFTEEVIHDALSCQSDDGSLQLSDTVSKKLKFESLVLRVASCLESEGDKVPMNQYLRYNKQLLHTAIILYFLKTTHIPPELKEKHEKAVKYLRTELGSDFEEVMDIISMMIMIINTVRAMKEAEGKGLATKFFDYFSSMVNSLYK